MKKLTTKIISFILTLSMIFSMSIPVFAAETLSSTEEYMDGNNINPRQMTNEQLILYNELIAEQVVSISQEYDGNIDSGWLRQEIIKNVGAREARKIFTRTISTRLKAWGLTSLSKVLPTAVTFVFAVLDPGTAIAEYLDTKDHKPNNGQLNYIL